MLLETSYARYCMYTFSVKWTELKVWISSNRFKSDKVASVALYMCVIIIIIVVIVKNLLLKPPLKELWCVYIFLTSLYINVKYWHIGYFVWRVFVCLAVIFSHSVVTSSSCLHLNRMLLARNCTRDVIKTAMTCMLAAELLLWQYVDWPCFFSFSFYVISLLLWTYSRFRLCRKENIWELFEQDCLQVGCPTNSIRKLKTQLTLFNVTNSVRNKIQLYYICRQVRNLI